MSLRKKSFQSILWNGCGQYSIQALSLLTAAVLSRLLDPSDFGLIGMILAANAFLSILCNAGLTSTVVQFKDLNQAAFRAFLGLAWFFGLVSGSFLLLGAPWLAGFFREPRLESIAYAWAPALFFTALTQVPQGMLQRKFLFARRSAVMIVSALLASVLAICMAFQGFGYWALVAQSLIRSFLLFIFSALAAGLPMLPQLDLPLYKKVFGYTGNLTLFNFINYCHRNLDNILIGRVLGAVSLGYYTRAYSLLNVFNGSIGGLVQPVMHAAMAQRQGDLPVLRRAYGQIISFLLWVCAPLMATGASFSPEIIRMVWGPSWDNAVTPFFWLAVAGMHQGVYGIIGTVFAVRYKTKELIYCGLITTTLYGAAIACGVQFGITEVARYYALMSWSIFFPLMLYIWIEILQGKVTEVLALLVPPVLIAFGLLLVLQNLRSGIIYNQENFEITWTTNLIWPSLLSVLLYIIILLRLKQNFLFLIKSNSVSEA